MEQAAEAAVRQAEVEGVTLQPSDSNSGYRGVYYIGRSKALAKPFYAKVWRAGKEVYLGTFATAEQAALAYARTPEAQAEAAKPAPLTAEEVVAQAAAEGLTLERSNRTAGYKGVSLQGRSYLAVLYRNSKQVYLGNFATAEEAALTVARADARTDPPAAPPAAAKRVAPPPPKPSPAKQPRHTPPPPASTAAMARLWRMDNTFGLNRTVGVGTGRAAGCRERSGWACCMHDCRGPARKV